MINRAEMAFEHWVDMEAADEPPSEKEAAAFIAGFEAAMTEVVALAENAPLRYARPADD